MQMMVRTVDQGKRLWSFTLDEKQLYELLCNTTAVRILRKVKDEEPWEMIELKTVKLVKGAADASDEMLAGISDEFVRAVFIERKRLGLKEYQLCDKEGADQP